MTTANCFTMRIGSMRRRIGEDGLRVLREQPRLELGDEPVMSSCDIRLALAKDRAELAGEEANPGADGLDDCGE